MALNDKEREDLVAYLDGELKDRKVHALEAKLGFDGAAQAEADAFRKTWSLLDYLPRPEPSVNFTHETLERLSAMRAGVAPKRRWRRVGLGFLWAASLLMAVLVGYHAGTWVADPNRSATGNDPDLRDLSVVQNLFILEHMDDLDFDKLQNDPDLFGDQAVGS